MKDRVRLGGLATLVGFVLLACSGHSSSGVMGDTDDTEGDASFDTTEDGGTDSESDAISDAAIDTESDPAVDTGTDVEADADAVIGDDTGEDTADTVGDDALGDDVTDMRTDPDASITDAVDDPTLTDTTGDSTSDVADADVDVGVDIGPDSDADLFDAGDLTCGEVSAGDQITASNAVCEGNVLFACDGENRFALGGDCDLVYGELADGVCIEGGGDVAGCGVSVGDPCFWNLGTPEAPDNRQVLCAGTPNGACAFRDDLGRTECVATESNCSPDGFEVTCDGDDLVFGCLVAQPFALACDSYGDGATCLTDADEVFCGGIPEDGNCNADPDGMGDGVTNQLRCADGLTCEGESTSGNGVCTAPCADFTLAAPPSTANGTNAGYGNDHSIGAGDCPGDAESYGGAGDDVVYSFVAPNSGTYTFTMAQAAGWGGVLYIGDDCDDVGGTCLAVSYTPIFTDDKIIVLDLTAGREVFVVVDGFSNAVNTTGSFSLTVTYEP